MTDELNSREEFTPGDLTPVQARLAYSIIETLLAHARAANDMIALMAQAFDQETLSALTNTPYWLAYLESKRAMERARQEIEEFTEIMIRLSGEPPATQ